MSRSVGKSLSISQRKTKFPRLVRKVLTRGGRVFFTGINREAGEAAKEQFLAEFGEGRAEFSVQDVRDADKWREVWLLAETFFGGQVRVRPPTTG